MVIVEEMFMDAPYVGEFTTTNTKYASDNLFKQEMQIEVGSFLVRMAMGGNKKAGSIINGNSKLRTVYDINEEEYAEENFQSIIENDGKPKLKMMDNAFGGGSSRNSNEDENYLKELAVKFPINSIITFGNQNRNEYSIEKIS